MTKPTPATPGVLKRMWRKIRSLFREEGDIVARRRALQDGAAKYGTYGTGDSGRHGPGM